MAASTTFVLKNVKATASGKIESFAAQEISRTTLPRVATPTTTLNTVTSDSVVFNIINTDDASATFSFILRQGSQSGSIVDSGTTVLVAPSASVTVGAIGLAASTTF